MDDGGAQILALGRCGDMDIAVPVQWIEETVKGPLTLTPLPRARPHVKGVFSFRGGAVPVVSLATLLRPDCGADCLDDGYAMVLRVDGCRFAVALDTVAAVVRPAAGEITELAPAKNNGDGLFSRLYTPAQGGRVAVVLDLAAALDVDGLRVALTGSASEAGRAPLSAPSDTVDGSSHVVFSVGEQRYALPASAIREVQPRPAAWESEMSHPVLRGFHRLRGKLTPVLDLAAMLGRAGVGEGRVLLFLEEADRRAALIVDAVREISCIPTANISDLDGALVAGAWVDPEGMMIHLLGSKLVAGALEFVASDAMESRGHDGAERADVGDARRYVFYRVGGSMLATQLDELESVARLPDDFQPTPSGGTHLLGYAQVHGRAVPIHDLAAWLGRTSSGVSPGAPVLIVRHGEKCAGFLVEQLAFMQTVAARALPGARPGAARSSDAIHFEQMVVAVSESGRIAASVLNLRKLSATGMAAN